MSKDNISVCQITKNKLLELKRQGELELPWEQLNESDFRLFAFYNNGEINGVIGLSLDCEVRDAICIDEFEVVKKYRNKGIGQKIISFFLDKIEYPIVTLLAKNISVSKFWIKCGFEIDYESPYEISMTYKKVIK